MEIWIHVHIWWLQWCHCRTLRDCGTPPVPAVADCQQPGESLSAPQNPWLRLYPLLPEQQLASWNLSVWRGVQAPGPLSANWDNLEDPSSSRASLRAWGRPGPVMAHLSSACFLPSLPTVVHSQAILPHTFLPANLPFSLFPRKPALRQRIIKSV